MKTIILLGASARSGVEFFQSLLDGHKEISQLPGYFYIDIFLKDIAINEDAHIIAQKFIKFIPEFFDSRLSIIERHNYLGINKNEFYVVNQELFINSFKEILKEKDRNIINILKALTLAYSAASGFNLEKIKIIILQIHQIHRIDCIDQFSFDILLIGRNPLSSISSYMNNLAYFKKKVPLPWPFCYNFLRLGETIEKANNLRKNFFLIKLEDLHLKNETTMKNFCNHYGLNYDLSMKISTFHNKIWWGDAVSKKDLNGVNPNFIDIILKPNFFEKDIRVIEYYFSNYFKKYDYKKILNQKKFQITFFLPLKFEIIIFIKNLMNLNFYNALLSIYYYFKRVKKLKILDYKNLPNKI
jgi:hypothetical protein